MKYLISLIILCASTHCADISFVSGDKKVVVNFNDWPKDVALTQDGIKKAAAEMAIQRQNAMKEVEEKIIELRVLKMNTARDITNLTININCIMEDADKYKDLQKDKSTGLIEFAKQVEQVKLKLEELKKFIDEQDKVLSDKKQTILDESAILMAIYSDK
jgi:hypothetical protein